MLVGAGGAVVGALSHGAISRPAAVAAPGLMVMAIILFMGAVSGAHLNPAVTFAFSLRGDFPWRRVPGYLVAQLLGATLACLFLWALYGKVGMLGATEPGAGISDWSALLTELVLTLGLVSTILGTASRAQNVGALSAVAVGGYVILAGLWSSPISGASMNPARSLGPDIARGDFSHLWVYVVGPLAGAALAVGAAWVLRGPGDEGGRTAARGTLRRARSAAERRRARAYTSRRNTRSPSSRREPRSTSSAASASAERARSTPGCSRAQRACQRTAAASNRAGSCSAISGSRLSASTTESGASWRASPAARR